MLFGLENLRLEVIVIYNHTRNTADGVIGLYNLLQLSILYQLPHCQSPPLLIPLLLGQQDAMQTRNRKGHIEYISNLPFRLENLSRQENGSSNHDLYLKLMSI